MLDKAEYSAFESTLNSLSYRIVSPAVWNSHPEDGSDLSYTCHLQACDKIRLLICPFATDDASAILRSRLSIAPWTLPGDGDWLTDGRFHDASRRNCQVTCRPKRPILLQAGTKQIPQIFGLQRKNAHPGAMPSRRGIECRNLSIISQPFDLSFMAPSDFLIIVRYKNALIYLFTYLLTYQLSTSTRSLTPRIILLFTLTFCQSGELHWRLVIRPSLGAALCVAPRPSVRPCIRFFRSRKDVESRNF